MLQVCRFSIGLSLEELLSLFCVCGFYLEHFAGLHTECKGALVFFRFLLWCFNGFGVV